MKKSWVYVLSIVVLLAVAAAGCGQKKETAQASGDGDATVLNFWTFQELHKGFTVCLP